VQSTKTPDGADVIDVEVMNGEHRGGEVNGLPVLL
jgi:hypothetical protein